MISIHASVIPMQERNPSEIARDDEREGKAKTTQAGEFIREEIHHIREGKHGAESPEQAIAIGLSKARRAGVRLPPPRKGKASARTRKRAKRDLALAKGAPSRRRPKATRSRATLRALRRKGRRAASRTALARHARRSARKRGPAARKASARKAVRARTPAQRRASAKKAARTRRRSRS
jgi:hypothetical protein